MESRQVFKERGAVILAFLQQRKPGFWWFIGAIIGDGNVFIKFPHHRVSIGCCGELKDKILKHVGQFSVYRKNPEKDFYECYTNSREVAFWFRDELGICGKKSHTISVPKIIENDEQFFEFLRGYFDTDGSVGTHTPKRKKALCFRCSFASCSLEMLEQIMERVKKYEVEGHITKNVKKIKGEEFTCWVLSFNGEYATRLLSLMYKNKGELYLSYKFDRYMQYLKDKDERSICSICGDKAFSDCLCHRCFWDARKEICSCGQPVLAHGVCRFMYDFYWNNKAINILRYCKDNSLSPIDALASKNTAAIDKMLHRNLISFYIAKHEKCISPAEFFDGKDVHDLSEQFSEARRMKRVKPASWFKTQDAVDILTLMKEKFGIESVFDPFAGWGARAAGASVLGMKYTANDANPYLIHELREVFKGKDEPIFNNVNSFATEPVDAHCLFSCPPYWEAEDYGYKVDMRNLVGTYERFLRRLLSLIVKFSRKESAKCVCICLEDFYISSKKYEFVADFSRELSSCGILFEQNTYRKMNNSFTGREKEYICLEIDCKKIGDNVHVNERNRTFSYGRCTECGEKVESDGLCRKHYSYFYRRVLQNRQGKSVTDPEDLFSRRPDLLEKLRKLDTIEEGGSDPEAR